MLPPPMFFLFILCAFHIMGLGPIHFPVLHPPQSMPSIVKASRVGLALRGCLTLGQSGLSPWQQVRSVTRYLLLLCLSCLQMKPCQQAPGCWQIHPIPPLCCVLLCQQEGSNGC